MPWKQTDAMNQRTEFALKAMQTDNFRALCQEYAISPKTGYKWKARFIARGLDGLREDSRRPNKSPTVLPEADVCEIIRIQRAHPNWGPRKVRAIYARTHVQTPSESSFKRVLERAGFTEKRVLRRREQSGRLNSARRGQAPNEVWTVDFKGWWHDASGRRCEPLTVRDEFSRYLLDLRALPDARTETVRGCFETLFSRYGLPGAIRSDNGSPFANTAAIFGLTRLSVWWLELGIDLERGRPGCPQDNGAHERLHLDIRNELEEPRLGERQAHLDEWRNTFNHERPHEALGMKVPAAVYRSSDKPYTPGGSQYEYRKMATRRVQSRGYITWANQNIFLSTALARRDVGVEWVAEGRFNVWFGRLHLGQIDSRTASFQPATKEQ
jgi:putative transposase